MFPQQGFRTGVGQGGGGSTNITIQNTLYVMKNGNDATALPNRLDKPYLTIQKASVDAVAGDTIYVFSGTYNEGVNDIFADNVNYVLQEGVTVECTTKVVSDFGVARNINIVGQGILKTQNQGEAVVYMTNSDSVLNLECYQILGEGAGITCTGEFNIKSGYLSALDDFGILLSDTIGVGSKTFGTINIDSISVLTGLSAVIINETNTDLVQRNIYFNCNELVNQSVKGSGSAISMSTNNETRIYISVNNCNQIGEEFLMSAIDTYFFVNNSNFNGVDFGIALYGVSVGLISNSNIKSVLNTLLCINESQLQINNCTIKSTGSNSISTVALEMADKAEIFALDCVFVSGTDASSVVLYQENNGLRIKNCQFIANDLATPLSIATDPALDEALIYVYGQCSTNLPTQSNILNDVAGTNIVVDPNIVENSNNFF